MDDTTFDTDTFDLPEDRDDEFDASALEEAIREHRRRELAELAALD